MLIRMARERRHDAVGTPQRKRDVAPRCRLKSIRRKTCAGLIALTSTLAGSIGAPGHAEVVPITAGARGFIGVETAHENPGFGAGIAASDDWVAAYWALDVSPLDTLHGRVRLYRRTGTRLDLAQVITPESLGLNRSLAFGAAGLAFSSDGASLFVALTSYNEAPFGPGGHVFVFKRQPDQTWQLRQTLEQSVPAGMTAHFGFNLATSGDILAIGEPLETGPGFPGYLRGRVHVYRQDAAGAWHREATLLPAAAQNGDAVGQFIGLAGDQLVVTRRGSEVDGAVISVFDHRNGAWHEAGSLSGSADVALTGTTFSYSADQRCLAFNGKLRRLILQRWDKNAVFVYCRDGSGALQPADTLWDGDADDTMNYARFGSRVLFVGNDLLISASGAASGGSGGIGRLYEFRAAGGSSWEMSRHWTPRSPPGVTIRSMAATLARSGGLIVLGAPGTDHAAHPATNGLLLLHGIDDVFVNGLDF